MFAGSRVSAGIFASTLALASAGASASGDLLPVTPLEIVTTGDEQLVLRLLADGTIVDSTGATVGRVLSSSVMFDDNRLFEVEDDGAVTRKWQGGRGRFDAEDTLVFEARGRRISISVGDDGRVTSVDASDRPSSSPRFRVLGLESATRRARRTIALLALSVVLREREEKSRERSVSITLDVPQVPQRFVELVGELRLAHRWSLALRAGGGAREVAGSRATAWEAGLEPRYFLVGNFGTGLYFGGTARFAHTARGPVGFDGLHTPPGLSLGALVGVKSVDVPIITPDASIGVVSPLFVPSTELTHPALAVVGRIGIGCSF